MKKIVLKSILSISTALLFTACGGGNDGEIMSGGNSNITSDKESPIITLNGDSKVSLIVGREYIELGAIASDDVDGNLTSSVTKNSVDVFNIGEQTITYSVTDKAGNKANVTRVVTVESLDNLLPADTNTLFAKGDDKNFLYFADPQPIENGLNRVVRVDYKNMNYVEAQDSFPLTNNGRILIPGKTHTNPHSVDRAGDTDKFYVRTQNAYSFDVINFKTGEVKTVPLTINGLSYSPRAFGAYNKKYNIQLISGRNATGLSIVGIIDVETDNLITSLAEPAATGSTTTGHAKWIDEDHFVMIDRANKWLVTYKINKVGDNLNIEKTQWIPTSSSVHALERVTVPKNVKDLYTFYAMGEGFETPNGKVPLVIQYIFNPETSQFSIAKSSSGAELVTWFNQTDNTYLTAQNVSSTTHHGGITPDGKHFIAPVYDGKVYKLDRITMEAVAMVDTNSGTDVGKGLGAAHVEFSESLNIAVITNHWSEYITIIDMSDFTVKKHIRIYAHAHPHNPANKHLMQPHFAQISEDGKYFYTFASQDNGRFVKVNLETLEVEESIYVGGAPEQAHS